MKVVHLEVAKYPPNRKADHGWESFDTTYPTWEEIESAIRRLDRNEWPYIYMITQYSAMGETLWVRGGRGEYQIIFVRDEDVRRVNYNELSRDSERVLICDG